MSAERWGALPLGELHAFGECCYCGAHGAERLNDEDEDGTLRRAVIGMTRAVGLVCIDVIACERRRYRKGNP